MTDLRRRDGRGRTGLRGNGGTAGWPQPTTATNRNPGRTRDGSFASSTAREATLVMGRRSHDPIDHKRSAGSHEEPTEQTPHGRPCHSVREPCAGSAGGNGAQGERSGDAPVDITERPVRRQRGDREDADYEEARANGFAHVETEHQQIHGDEEEPSAVGEQTREKPDRRRSRHQQGPVHSSCGPCSAGGLADGSDDPLPHDDEDEPRRDEDRLTSHHARQQGTPDRGRDAAQQRPGGGTRPRFVVP